MKVNLVIIILFFSTSIITAASALTEQQVRDFLNARLDKEEAMEIALTSSQALFNDNLQRTLDSADIVTVTHSHQETLIRTITTYRAALKSGVVVTATERNTQGKIIATCYARGMNLSPESFYVCLLYTSPSPRD